MKKAITTMYCVLLAAVFGCVDVKQSVPRAEYLADVEPDGGVAVSAAREGVKDGDPVTLVGQIGGSAEPFVEGLAAFTVMDVSDDECGSSCPCCSHSNKVPTAIVCVIDKSGVTVPEDARELLGVKERSRVVVSGTARLDEVGNLTVMAGKVFIRR